MARRRFLLPVGVALFFLIFYYTWTGQGDRSMGLGGTRQDASSGTGTPDDDKNYFWRKLPTRYPVRGMKQFPRGTPAALPKIQAIIEESEREREVRLKRQQAVKDAFQRCWASYKTYSLGHDELAPLSGYSKDTFGGWGATLVDSLDTLWIMSMHDEFEEAVVAATKINFQKSSLHSVNAFETTIRYLGGFLAAYDLSGDQRLLRKAKEVGEMLYVAFDTPNRMPITRWDFNNAKKGRPQEAPESALIAEIGSLCMEFTRLSMITGDPRWYDATERIREVLERQQRSTKVPGLWPITVYPKSLVFDADNTFTLGGMADSVFEYLPKMHALVGGLIPAYRSMYEHAMDAAIKHNLWRPMLPNSPDILVAGTVHVETRQGETDLYLEHQGQHLACFAGGMLALGGKLLNNREHLETARRLVDGCIWTYEAMPLGIMPETFYMVSCESDKECAWDESLWKKGVLRAADEDDLTNMARADRIIAEKRLPKGFIIIPDTRYILRPEAIESVFVLYRATGRKDLLESAWAMFEAIQKNTVTKLANAALADVTVDRNPPMEDSMESFWMGETLKYFYLIFSEPDLISLDEWVFNTEAHPFRRLV
ncbi:glycoside hydrolase [Biscogniauxia sp. FL1348]|nr:glycoside hydrolase [Biscogniauxia sp. FL1348]